MAHLMVSTETVVVDHPQDENAVGSRSIGKHRRTNSSDMELGCNDSQLMDSTKRRALASITNQLDKGRSSRNSTNKSLQKRSAKLNKTPRCSKSPNQVYNSNMGNFYIPTFNLFVPVTSASHGELNPIGSEMNSTKSDSRMSLSLPTMSSSFKSMETSLTFDSPMNISSPDLYSSKCNSKDFVDIDLVEDSCGCTGEYANSIFTYLREAEVRFHPNPQYMAQQHDITVTMRCILVDWLVEVTEEFKLDQQTLYMALSIVDRFLSSMSVVRTKLQLVGGTAMYLASKFEEIAPPEISEFVYITDDTYTKSQIVRMERMVLKVLDFNLAAPTANNFLLRYLKASEADPLNSGKVGHEVASSSLDSGSDDAQLAQTIQYLSMYLCELALQDADPYLKYYPSVIAASAVCLARHTLGQNAWPSILQHYSGYSVSDISNCVQDMHRTLALAPRHSQQAIRTKYSSETFHKVSTMKAPETLPC